MAHKILTIVAKFCTLCLFFLPTMMLAQYTVKKTGSITDITSQATSGTNAWNALPNNVHFQLNSLALAPNTSAWFAGTDNTVYAYNPLTKTWTPHPEIGSVTGSLAVRSANQVYFLKSDPACNAWAPDLRLFEWNGTSLVPKNGCFSNFSVTVEGTIYGVSSHGSVPTSLWYSTDDGSTFTQWATTGWKYANMSNSGFGCAIDTSGHLFGINPQKSTATLGLPNISGTAAGCIDELQGDAVTIAWNTAGSVYLLNTSTSSWQLISGLTVNQVAAIDKGSVVALDLTGQPYHWNVYAPTITATITGTFDNFPMGSLNPPPTHTSHIKVNFPHGTNTAPASTQTIPYNGAMNNSYTDYAPGCDVFYGDPGSQECVPAVGVDDSDCSVAGPLNVTPDNNGVGFGLSIDNIEWTGPYNQTAPKLSGNGTTGSWTGVVRNRFQDACGFTGGTPSCQVDGEWNYVADFITGWWINDPTGTVESTVQHNWVLDQMQIDAGGGYSPWSVLEYYVQEGGAPVCMGAHRPIRYNGDYYLQPPCQ